MNVFFFLNVLDSFFVYRKRSELVIKCPSYTFQCSKDSICISFIQVCDGKIDCKNGEDERNCSIDYFQCLNSKEKIPIIRLCDFSPDCKDKSDEINCGLKFQSQFS